MDNDAKVTVPAPALPASLDEIRTLVVGIGARLERVERRVESVADDQGRAATRMSRIEAKQAPVDDAMQSHHEIEMGLSQNLRQLEQTVLLRLGQQDELQKKLAENAKRDAELREQKKKEEAEERAVALAEERRQESIAAKKLADDRAQKNLEAQEATKRQAILVPALCTLMVAAIGAVGIYFNAQQARAAAEQSEARQVARYSALKNSIEAVASAPSAPSVEAPPAVPAAAPSPGRRAK